MRLSGGVKMKNDIPNETNGIKRMISSNRSTLIKYWLADGKFSYQPVDGIIINAQYNLGRSSFKSKWTSHFNFLDVNAQSIEQAHKCDTPRGIENDLRHVNVLT
jgi:hypothetical protein